MSGKMNWAKAKVARRDFEGRRRLLENATDLWLEKHERDKAERLKVTASCARDAATRRPFALSRSAPLAAPFAKKAIDDSPRSASS
jgi:hypothetical protein